MNPQNGRRWNCAKNIQLDHPVWTESRACTLYWNRVYWRDFLPLPTETAVCSWRNNPRRPFCGLIYIQLIHLWSNPSTVLLYSVITDAMRCDDIDLFPGLNNLDSFFYSTTRQSISGSREIFRCTYKKPEGRNLVRSFL